MHTHVHLCQVVCVCAQSGTSSIPSLRCIVATMQPRSWPQSWECGHICKHQTPVPLTVPSSSRCYPFEKGLRLLLRCLCACVLSMTLTRIVVQLFNCSTAPRCLPLLPIHPPLDPNCSSLFCFNLFFFLSPFTPRRLNRGAIKSVGVGESFVALFCSTTKTRLGGPNSLLCVCVCMAFDLSDLLSDSLNWPPLRNCNVANDDGDNDHNGR